MCSAGNKWEVIVRTVCILLEVSELFRGEFALRLAHGCGGGSESQSDCENVNDRDREGCTAIQIRVSRQSGLGIDYSGSRGQRGQLSQ